MDAEKDPNITQFAHAQKVALRTIVTTVSKFQLFRFRFPFQFLFQLSVFHFIHFHLPPSVQAQESYQLRKRYHTRRRSTSTTSSGSSSSTSSESSSKSGTDSSRHHHRCKHYNHGRTKHHRRSGHLPSRTKSKLKRLAAPCCPPLGLLVVSIYHLIS